MGLWNHIWRNDADDKSNAAAVVTDAAAEPKTESPVLPTDEHKTVTPTENTTGDIRAEQKESQSIPETSSKATPQNISEKASETKTEIPPHPPIAAARPVKPTFSPDFYHTTTIMLNDGIGQSVKSTLVELTDWLKTPDSRTAMRWFSANGEKTLQAETLDDVWFISDIHGDLYTLRQELRYIFAQSQDPVIVFMGDLFDRGCASLETVETVFDLMKQRPQKVLWLIGNHDSALAFDTENQKFTSKTSGDPLFCDELNKKMEKVPEIKAFGQEVIRFIQDLPHALFFRDGLIVVHGGIPLPDTLENIKTKEDLESAQVRYDFSWVRLEDKSVTVPRQPEKIGTESDRTSVAYFKQQRANPPPEGPGGHLLCWQMFQQKVQELCGFTPSCLLRGHDHPGKGFENFAWYPCVTLNSQKAERVLTSEFFATIAHKRTGALAPEVFSIELDKTAYHAFYEAEEKQG